MLHARRRRRMLGKRVDKFVECFARSVRLDMHAIARVKHGELTCAATKQSLGL